MAGHAPWTRLRLSDEAGPRFLGFFVEEDGADLAIVRRRESGLDLTGAKKERWGRDLIFIDADVFDQGTLFPVQQPVHAAPEHGVVKRALLRLGGAGAAKSEDEKPQQHQISHWNSPLLKYSLVLA